MGLCEEGEVGCNVPAGEEVQIQVPEAGDNKQSDCNFSVKELKWFLLVLGQ